MKKNPKPARAFIAKRLLGFARILKRLWTSLLHVHILLMKRRGRNIDLTTRPREAKSAG